MKHILVRTAGAVTLTCALFAASPASAGDLHVVIRLYDMATSDAAGRAIAMRTAAKAIASAGIAVRWRDCSQGGAAHPCRTVRDDGDLVVRIMPVAAGAVRGEEVELETPQPSYCAYYSTFNGGSGAYTY